MHGGIAREMESRVYLVTVNKTDRRLCLSSHETSLSTLIAIQCIQIPHRLFPPVTERYMFRGPVETTINHLQTRAHKKTAIKAKNKKHIKKGSGRKLNQGKNKLPRCSVFMLVGFPRALHVPTHSSKLEKGESRPLLLSVSQAATFA